MTVNLKVVELEMKERVAILSLNRPESLNALNIEVLQQLVQCLKEVEESQADIVVLQGKGNVFSAGGDIKMMLDPNRADSFRKVMDLINEVTLRLYTLPQLTISAIHGAAAGLGLSIALASDYIIAQKDAKIAMNFIGIGLIPDGGGHFLLAKRLGNHRAKQLIWQGETLSAEKAYKIGIIDEIKEGDLAKHVEDYVSYWLKKPALALKETKRIFVETSIEELKTVLQLEKRSQFSMSQSDDHQEGIEAFLAKRLPVFNQRSKDISEN
ncbi:enoyl-CoA hydratase [Priestia flexa]|uniref:Enoyl-CoA hydratase n=1 Tax=Priestia flexa TaxID=86664 RepID=A0A8I1MI21_9BACI|nr:enoyl-CoA hydratase [Priestia flexa]MBN8253557.1 enoyl-CoA hydratase [Priestia flexa]MBN8435560.1 enoyl-CoA hydratase [Priestia flexa]MCA0968118.1 enoyl-CoA hydratase [Priestia flexa]RIV04512.1 enoyl-CoA hydratase [Priestia flexa]UIR30558.1 enoyl-CoA hydratase [Priestia flexa]